VRLLDLGFFRVGSEQYAEENRTYGLATLRKRHVKLARRSAIFDYSGKGRARHLQEVSDPAILPVLRALKRRRGGGDELLAYKHGRRWIDLTSTEINEYLKRLAGREVSAKDFRTWNATVLAAVALAVSGEEDGTKTARQRAVREAVKKVAVYLSNTPAVCRSAYIDPRVIDRFNSGVTIADALEEIIEASDPTEFPDRGAIERAVLELLG
jgi:DNA topoisomerase IB